MKLRSYIHLEADAPRPHIDKLNPGDSGPFAVVRLDRFGRSYIAIHSVDDAQAWIDVFTRARDLLAEAYPATPGEPS